jgi:hypothetical protein
MTTDRIRPATMADVLYLAPRLRRRDVDEIRASYGQAPLKALTYSLNHSDQSYVFLNDSRRPCAIYGTAPVPSHPQVASAWLLGSDEIADPANLRSFLRLTRGELDRLHAGRYLVLFNYVDERNEASVQWLRWAGCQFIQRHEAYGVERRPFLEFIHIEKNPACVSPQ